MKTKQLQLSTGQYSDKGRKSINQDFHGIFTPLDPLLTSKGIAIALADGISSSQVSQHASQAAVSGFLEDYYCTPETWGVKNSVKRVLVATNSWLHAQTKNSHYRFDIEKGYVCTFSALVIKSATAHIFHVGDSRIYQVHEKHLEQLTEDHRYWLSKDKSYLSRAMGIHNHLDIDYRTLPISKNDIFLLATDGVYEFVDSDFIIQTIHTHAADLDLAAKIIVDKAYEQNSHDNLTVQIIRVDEVALQNAEEIYRQLTTLPFAPLLNPRMEFDGYKIIRDLHSSSRSHVYLAQDQQTQQSVILKIPSVDLRDDPAYLEHFMMEEWIAKRITSPFVLKAYQQSRQRQYLYTVMEYIDGQSLKQWMMDHPEPDLESVRNIVEQIAKGLMAFHRLEMLHQDIRPENIMIDKTGTVKIIDFGSTRVAGVSEISSSTQQNEILGTFQFTAPEYFLGESGTPRSDLFSLGVIAYQMLSGRLPYGTQVSRATNKTAQMKLNYQSILDAKPKTPIWVDEVIKKAVEPNPYKRYTELSEFVYDLRHPSKVILKKTRPPLIERNPVAFWKGLSAILAIIIFALLIKQGIIITH